MLPRVTQIQLQFLPPIMATNNRYAGRDTYGNPDVLSTGLAEDL